MRGRSARAPGSRRPTTATGGTHGDSRFDYVFYFTASALALKSVNVPDTRVSGMYPSDHDPVVATFAMN